MIATSAFEVFSGSDLQEKPIEGTSTCASIWQVAFLPENRKCFEGSSCETNSPVAIQTILKLIRAGVATESKAGQPGWSTTGRSRISSVTDLPSGVTLRQLSGTGTTQ